MSETTQTAMYYNGNWYGRSGNTDALDARITQTANNIAPRQISDTSSKLIAVGEYFTDKLGRLCVCDVQIASGGSIVIGSNCHVVSEGLGNESRIITITIPDDIQTASNWNVLGQYRTQGYHILNIVSVGNMYGTPSFYYSRIRQGADEWDIRLTFTWAYGEKDMITADLMHDSNMNYTFSLYNKGSLTDWNTVFGSGAWTGAVIFLYK